MILPILFSNLRFSKLPLVKSSRFPIFVSRMPNLIALAAEGRTVRVFMRLKLTRLLHGVMQMTVLATTDGRNA